jgi:hypothetical protein
MWMFGNGNIIQSKGGIIGALLGEDAAGGADAFTSLAQGATAGEGGDLSSRVLQAVPHLFAVFLIIFVYLVLTRVVWKFVKGILGTILSIICPCLGASQIEGEDNPPFQQAIDDGTLIGVYSYSLDSNPEYADAFGLNCVGAASRMRGLTENASPVKRKSSRTGSRAISRELVTEEVDVQV